jgi:peptidoglycan/LPS O-acetylase OafA/YrhL
MSSSLIAREPTRTRVAGLDSIRFICALWVLFGHFGFIPVFASFDNSSLIRQAIHGIYNNTFSGPAAVIVFFVISGFCIHFPFREKEPPSWRLYYVRRYVRILPPMLAAIILARVLKIRLPIFHESILWSLICEEIYYALYPLLRHARRFVTWDLLILMAYGASLLLILFRSHDKNYPSFGPFYNWILGLPCWLLGCRLAERFDAERPIRLSTGRMNALRLGIWFLSWCASVARFHSPIGYPVTLNLFAIAAAYWLSWEIQFFSLHRPYRLLEWAGRWSYSLYLFHVLGNELFNSIFGTSTSGMKNWVLRTFWILASSYVFYLLVERPTHRLARRLTTTKAQTLSGLKGPPTEARASRA